jgi:hypothetical protein
MGLSVRSAGRLTRAAICGLLAATALPTSASADVGIGVGVPVVSPVPVPVATPSLPTHAIPAPVVAAQADVKTPVVAPQPAVRAASSAEVATSKVVRVSTTTRAAVRTGLSTSPAPRRRMPAKRAPNVGVFFSATSVSMPFVLPTPHPCTGEVVTLRGIAHIQTAFQPDGTIRLWDSVSGTGEAPSGRRYASSTEMHERVLGDFTTTIYEYSYTKYIASQENATLPPFIAGDDFYARVRFDITADPLGGPIVSLGEIQAAPQGCT